MKFEVYKDKAGEFRWRLKANNGEPIASSGEGYKEKRSCLHAIDLVKTSNEAGVVELPDS
ncbi:MAG: YegP family protein [Opitutales bacterium]